MDLNNKRLLSYFLKKHYPSKESPLYIGRKKPDDNINRPLLIDFSPDTSVSRDQAILWIENRCVLICDKYSAHGTFINDRKLNKNEIIKLQNNDIIRFSKYVYVISIHPDDIIQAENHASSPQTKAVNLTEVVCKHRPTQYRPLHIGRRDGHDDERFPILDLTPNRHVSRKHAIVWLEANGKVFIKDTKSANGTLVNDEDIRYESKRELKPKDIVKIGGVVMLLDNLPDEVFPNEVVVEKRRNTLLQLDEVEKTDKKLVFIENAEQSGTKKLLLRWKEKYRLHKTSLRIENGDFVVIMGPSGCGKSTVLKIMCGEISSTRGAIVYFKDGEPIHIEGYANNGESNWSLIKDRIGYVPQYDVLHNELTVEEELRYAARLRLSKKNNHNRQETITNKHREDRIDEVLSQLNLNQPEIRQRPIKSLSGGQRKRVSIAIEMLGRPELLFLDEPTSPLDPGSVDDLLEILRQMNSDGTTIVMVSHKEQDLNASDAVKVLFLGNGGYQVYYDSNGHKLYDKFEVNNPKDIYKIISEKDEAQKISLHYFKNKKTTGLVKPYKMIPRAGAIRQSSLGQFYTLLHRLFKERLKKTGSFIGQNVGIPLLMAGLVAAINDCVSVPFLFWATIIAVFLGITGHMSAIVGEKDIYEREKLSVINNFPYLMSKFVYAVCVSLIQSLVVVSVFWLRFNVFENDIPIFNMHQFLFMYWYIIVSASIIGLLVSSVVKSQRAAWMILPFLLILQIVGSGVIEPIENKGMEILSYATASRWGTESFARIQNDPGKEILYLDTTRYFNKTSTDDLNNDAIKKIRLRFVDTLYVSDVRMTKDQVAGIDTVFKTVYQNVSRQDTLFKISHDQPQPVFTFEREKKQISVWDTLSFVNNPNLWNLFDSFRLNLLALSLLNFLLLIISWFSLEVKRRS